MVEDSPKFVNNEVWGDFLMKTIRLEPYLMTHMRKLQAEWSMEKEQSVQLWADFGNGIKRIEPIIDLI